MNFIFYKTSLTIKYWYIQLSIVIFSKSRNTPIGVEGLKLSIVFTTLFLIFLKRNEACINVNDMGRSRVKLDNNIAFNQRNVRQPLKTTPKRKYQFCCGFSWIILDQLAKCLNFDFGFFKKNPNTTTIISVCTVTPQIIL